MPIRASRAYAAVALAAGITFMGGLGCGGGERAQQSSPQSQQAAVEPVAGKADAVTVSYYYLPG
jgi:hypothetical protein